MAVQTPIAGSVYDTVAGSVRGSFSKFASVANNDTYVSNLAQIIGVTVDGGSTGGTLGATWSGGTITFLSSAGSITNVSLVVWGF